MSKSTREQFLNPPRTGTRTCETQEEWLLRAIAILDWYFSELDKPIPSILIRKECLGDADQYTIMGQCQQFWYMDTKPPQIHEARIFIAPDVVEDLQVLEILVHELAHAVLPEGVQHGEPFKDLADKLGLEGKITSTYAGTKLRIKLLNISNTLGPYPEN